MEVSRFISIRELKLLAGSLFDRMESAGIDRIPVESQLYWTVFPSEAFSVEVPALVMGDVIDDLHDLRIEVGDKGRLPETNSFWHPLHHLAGALTFLAAIDINGQLTGASLPGGAS